MCVLTHYDIHFAFVIQMGNHFLLDHRRFRKSEEQIFALLSDATGSGLIPLTNLLRNHFFEWFLKWSCNGFRRGVPLTGKFTLEFILAFQAYKEMPHSFDENFVVKLNNVAANIIFL